MFPIDSLRSHSRSATTWLFVAAVVASVIALGPRRAVACGGPCGEELVPRLTSLTETPTMPANGWLYWQADFSGPSDPSGITIVDTRDGSAVPFTATELTVFGAWVLKPDAPLVPGVTYDVTPILMCATPGARSIVATDAQPAPSSPGGRLELIDRGSYQYHQLGHSPSGLCTWPAEGRYADVGVVLDPALLPWRDSLMVEWRVDFMQSFGSSVDGFYPRAHLGASLAGVELIRLGTVCGPTTNGDGSLEPIFDHGFAASGHHVEAFAYIAGASGPISLGSIDVALSCEDGHGGCAVADGVPPRSTREARGALAALAVAAAVVVARRRRRAR